jgi:two-component SAPR family response regulator
MRIIFTSGYTEAGVVRHQLLSSEALFVQKPVDPAKLSRLIRETLDRPKDKPS